MQVGKEENELGAEDRMKVGKAYFCFLCVYLSNGQKLFPTPAISPHQLDNSMWGPDNNTPPSQISPGDKLSVAALLSAAPGVTARAQRASDWAPLKG